MQPTQKAARLISGLVAWIANVGFILMMEPDSTGKTDRIFLGQLNQVEKVYMNVGQNVIVITEDKLRLHLSNGAKKEVFFW